MKPCCQAKVNAVTRWLGPECSVQIGNAGRNFVRLAGVSGAIAVAMGAYGAHGAFPKSEGEDGKDMEEIFWKAQRLHLIHSAVLMAAPLTRRPCLTGGLWSLGIILFSGSLYARSLTGNATYGRFAPIGGTILIFGWLAVAL
ncbi:PREDICTED: transmembrane protein 256 homolog [Priapulus caudatus]|uniref:Transmembrane protein 256 homolog n=1 Tax=Priapulus caudatus TaxID=37621 RepID=A0ABM1E8S5_PRICU|nr:PREDICTED: transmembrane protein 256 homolog [Priapulus caudatus]